MQASAGFVSASALGMACGPALAGILQIDFKLYKLTFNQNTLPGWVMAVAWLIYLVWLWITFKEPSHDTEENQGPQQSNDDGIGLILLQHATYCLNIFYYVLVRSLIYMSPLILQLCPNIQYLDEHFGSGSF